MTTLYTSRKDTLQIRNNKQDRLDHTGGGTEGAGGRHKHQTKYTCTHFEYHGYRHVILKVWSRYDQSVTDIATLATNQTVHGSPNIHGILLL